MEFKDYIIGPTEPALFAACIFFSGIGVLLVLLMGTRLRDKNSLDSPQSFSWKYLRSDNARRIWANAIAILATLRFATEITGMELNPFRAFSIGMGWDIIMLVIKQKTSWLDPKPKP